MDSGTFWFSSTHIFCKGLLDWLPLEDQRGWAAWEITPLLYQSREDHQPPSRFPPGRCEVSGNIPGIAEGNSWLKAIYSILIQDAGKNHRYGAYIFDIHPRIAGSLLPLPFSLCY